jgi:hypothetical protein
VARDNVDWNEIAGVPGAVLVKQGLADLQAGRESIAALLVCVGASRLRELGFSVRSALGRPELRLYERLADEYGDEAHSRYNGLIRRLVSFERSLCAK